MWNYIYLVKVNPPSYVPNAPQNITIVPLHHVYSIGPHCPLAQKNDSLERIFDVVGHCLRLWYVIYVSLFSIENSNKGNIKRLM